MNRSERLSALMKLLPAAFEELVYKLHIPSGYLPGSGAPLSIRAIEVLRYIESNRRIDELDALLLSDPLMAVVAPEPAQRQARSSKVRCFIEFASTDVRSFELLSRSLKALQRSRNELEIWSKALITPGLNWQREIQCRLDEADVVLLLISSEFLASDESYDIARRAIEAGKARVVPVIMSPCDWIHSAIGLGNLMPLPKDGTPILAHRDRDSALLEVVQGLDTLISVLVANQSKGTAPSTADLQPSPQPLAPGKIKILFLGSAPTNAGRLQLGDEARDIDRRLRSSPQRERFQLDQAWAVTASDLSQILLRHRPTITHISGHGSANEGLIFHDEQGKSVSVSGEALAHLFSLLGSEGIRGVVLNACYSGAQAVAIAHKVEFVIGISDTIGQAAARAFSMGFYTALAAGESVQRAFEFGCIQIEILGPPGAGRPQLHLRSGSNSSKLRLV